MLIAGAAALLVPALRPCEALHMQFQRSGCTALIDLPAGFRTMDVSIGGIHVANVRDQLVLVGASRDSAPKALILSTQTWQVLEEYAISDIEARFDNSEGLPPRYVWNSTRLMVGESGRMGFSEVRMPDNSVCALADTRQVTIYDV
jgi:hypothetical protein